MDLPPADVEVGAVVGPDASEGLDDASKAQGRGSGLGYDVVTPVARLPSFSLVAMSETLVFTSAGTLES